MFILLSSTQVLFKDSSKQYEDIDIKKRNPPANWRVTPWFGASLERLGEMNSVFFEGSPLADVGN